MDRLSNAELTTALVERSGQSAKTVKAVLDALRDTVVEETSGGSEVVIPKLVKFKPKFVAAKRKGEMVRNPSTGEMSPRAESVPAKFSLKATALQGAFAGGPSMTSRAGRYLKEVLGG